LYLNKNFLEAKKVLIKIHGNDRGERENTAIETSVHTEKNKESLKLIDLLKPSLRFILGVGLVVGILQQITE